MLSSSNLRMVRDEFVYMWNLGRPPCSLSVQNIVWNVVVSIVKQFRQHVKCIGIIVQITCNGRVVISNVKVCISM